MEEIERNEKRHSLLELIPFSSNFRDPRRNRQCRQRIVKVRLLCSSALHGP